MTLTRQRTTIAALALSLALLLPVVSTSVDTSLPNAAAVASLPSGFELKKVLTGLSGPSDIVFAPDGRWFITEDSGRVRVVKNGQLLSAPLVDIRGHVNTYVDRGLLSLALDPDFATNGYIYLAYTYHRPGTLLSDPQTNRLTRIQLSPPTADVMTPQVDPPEVVILGSITTPYDNGQLGVCNAGTDCMPVDSTTHAIGTVVFAPDKSIYLSVGEGASPDFADKRALRSQDKNWLSGKLLHIDKNGKGLPTNPFWNGNADAPISKVYQYGFRNPFRVAIHPQFGPYIADVGWNKWEEVNHSTGGANFGWPCYVGVAVEKEYSTAPDTKPTCDSLYAQPGAATHPMYAYPHPNPDTGAAVIGGTFYTGNSYPAEFNNNYFFVDFVQGFMKRIILDSSGEYQSIIDFAAGMPSMSKVFSFPDGNLGLISYNSGEIYKITFTTGNRAPVAVASSDKTYGALPLAVKFDGQSSYDPDGTQVTYLWNFGDGTPTSTLASPSHSFASSGKKVVTLTVSDGQLSGSAQIAIFAGDQPPNISITKPADNSAFTDGQTVNYAGTASDPEDGSLSSSQVNWYLVLHHNTHIHPVFDGVHAFSGNFVADAQGDDTYYELVFSATDSLGLAASKSVVFDVFPPAEFQYAPYLTLTGSNYDDTSSKVELQLPKFTVASWFQTSTDYTSSAYVVNKGGSGSETPGSNQNYGIWMSASEQVQAGFETTGGSDNYVTSPLAYSDGKWHYAVATFDGAKIVLYIDGSQVATKSTTAVPDNTGTQPVRVGANSRAANGFFIGYADEVRVWNRAVTSAEVMSQYTGGIFDQSGQVLYLPFGVPADTTPPDTTITSTFDGDGNYVPNFGSTASTTMTIGFTGSDNVGVTGFEYHLDGSAPYTWVPVASSPLTLTNLPSGSHLFEVRALDAAGNIDTDPTGAGFSWTVAAASTGYHYSPYLTLTGSNYQDTSNMLKLQLQKFTVAAWFQTTQDVAAGDNALIVNKGGLGSDTAGKNMNYGIWLTSSEKVRAGFETTGGSDNYVTSPLAYSDGKWHYAVATFDGAKIVLYIDGSQVATKSTTAVPDNTGTQPVRVGANSRAANGFFIGYADEVRVWNRAISALEVQNAYDNGTFDTTGQNLYLSFG